MRTYQDAWRHGAVISEGYRECSSRYELIKRFCTNNFSDRFTVCDVGANMCYFGLRLTEDFKNSAVMAFEFDHFDLRKKHLDASDISGRIFLINRKLTVQDLSSLANIHRFDLVLAMSVLHHLPGDHAEWIRGFKLLGKNIIAEYAGDDNESRVKLRNGYCVPDDSTLLGYGNSHLAKFQRPIVHIRGN